MRRDHRGKLVARLDRDRAHGGARGARSLLRERAPILGLGALALDRGREACDRCLVLEETLQLGSPLLRLAGDLANVARLGAECLERRGDLSPATVALGSRFV